MTAKATSFALSPPIFLNTECKPHYPVFHKLSRNLNPISRIERICVSVQKEKAGSFSSGSRFTNAIKKTAKVEPKLKPLWDDGHGTQNMMDLLESAKNLIQYSDGGSLRWFCPVECGPPQTNSPVLMFIPCTSGFLFAVTSFKGSLVELLLPLLEAIPEEAYSMLPLIACFALGDTSEIGKLINKTGNLSTSPKQQIEKLFLELSSFMSGVSGLADIFPKKTMQWKMKLLKAGTAFTNSRLHAVKAEVLLLASGKDSILPSETEARRLSKLLKNCTARLLKDYDHGLLLERGINLLNIIKSTCTYRRSKKRDYIKDFIPPSMSEYDIAFDQKLGLYHMAISPVAYSTLANGQIVRGLKGVPDQGPVLLVGYHMLFGADLGFIVQEFLREKNIMVHGMAHPYIFSQNLVSPLQEISGFDHFKVFGAVPATPSTFFKILSNKAYGLLYPGGAREALHRKGEEYKLFWPEEPEFVRMAARFGAKIVPFGVVGEDDLVEQFLDYNDVMKMPLVNNLLLKNSGPNFSRESARNPIEAAVNSPDFFIPGFYPKVPGRIYFLFGKPIETIGREDLIKDEARAKEFYLNVKSEVEKSMAYLIKKRDEDPNRQLLGRRMLYHAISAPSHQIPAFEP